ncbi:MAG: hypothetical protein KDE33_21165, partial [Bacteroidetes bacterium]|nr:hypothetical protein [Bacteroidota bacterium]
MQKNGSFANFGCVSACVICKCAVLCVGCSFIFATVICCISLSFLHLAVTVSAMRSAGLQGTSLSAYRKVCL